MKQLGSSQNTFLTKYLGDGAKVVKLNVKYILEFYFLSLQFHWNQAKDNKQFKLKATALWSYIAQQWTFYVYTIIWVKRWPWTSVIYIYLFDFPNPASSQGWYSTLSVMVTLPPTWCVKFFSWVDFCKCHSVAMVLPELDTSVWDDWLVKSDPHLQGCWFEPRFKPVTWKVQIDYQQFPLQLSIFYLSALILLNLKLKKLLLKWNKNET